MDTHQIITNFTNYLKLSLSKNTACAYASDIKSYMAMINNNLEEISINSVEVFLTMRYDSHKDHDTSLTTRHRRLISLRRFTRWLYKHGEIKEDVLEDSKEYFKIKIPQRLPKAWKDEEITEIIEAEQGNTLLSIRNRAILEFLYCTGCRCSEVLDLQVQHIDFELKTAKVLGKGNKERMVLLNDSTILWMSKYMNKSRVVFSKCNTRGDKHLVFLSRNGLRLCQQNIRKIMDDISKKIGRHIHPHIFRHTFATEMLRGGADIRVIQEILGHSSLSTTAKYTAVVEADKKKAFMNSFPRK